MYGFVLFTFVLLYIRVTVKDLNKLSPHHATRNFRGKDPAHQLRETIHEKQGKMSIYAYS